MYLRNRIGSRIKVEQLENRFLLAVDLQIQMDPFESPNPGDEVTRVIRVFNNGDEVAEQVLVRASLTEELDDPVWHRRSGNARHVGDPTLGREPDFVVNDRADQIAKQGLSSVGDINGDGKNDFVAGWNSGRTKGSAKILFGGATTVEELDGFTISGSGYYLKVHPLGDVNADGFDDMAWGNSVILGAADIGRTGYDRFAVTDTIAVNGVGDLNGDGIDDIATVGLFRGQFGENLPVDTMIIWGSKELGATSFDAAAVVADQSSDRGLILSGAAAYAKPAGDLNGDGYQDAIVGHVFGNAVGGIVEGFESSVIYGGPSLSSASIDLADVSAENGFTFGNRFAGVGSRVTQTSAIGDFDGDGIDDIVFSSTSGTCTGCTATSLDGLTGTGGLIVVYGDTEIGAEFNEDENRHSVQKLTVRYVSAKHGQATTLDSHDINGDGLADLVFSVVPDDRHPDNRRFVLFGGQDFENADFGFPGESFSGFNGEDGYTVSGSLNFADIDGDGLLDELVQRDGESAVSVFLGRATTENTEPQNGDIEELLEIPVGRGVVYNVSGTVRDSPVVISSSVVSVTQPERILRDNIAGEKEGVRLSFDVEEPQAYVPGGETQLTLTLFNDGPANAEGVMIDDDITSKIFADSEWTRETKLFPTQFDLHRLTGTHGAGFSGPDVDFGSPPLPFRGLGIDVWSPGDLDGDGFDDVVANSIGQTVFFSGGSEVGSSGELPSPSRTDLPRPTIEPVGDINGDGLLDQITSDPLANGATGATYVVFGTESGANADVGALDGTNGFVVVGARRNDRTGHSVAVGDVNDDGFDDLIIGEGEPGDFDISRNTLRVHVLFGGENVGSSGEVELSSLNGVNGFRMQMRDAFIDHHQIFQTSVASGFDFNGDEIDDIAIGYPNAGATVFFEPSHGGVYIVYGRPQTSASGRGGVNDIVDVPFQGSVTYTITGTVRDDWDGTQSGTVRANVSAQQLELDPRSNVVTINPGDELLSDLDGDGQVGFRDFLILSSNFGKTEAAQSEGDLDGNGVVDFTDFLLLTAQFGDRG